MDKDKIAPKPPHEIFRALQNSGLPVIEVRDGRPLGPQYTHNHSYYGWFNGDTRTNYGPSDYFVLFGRKLVDNEYHQANQVIKDLHGI